MASTIVGIDIGSSAVRAVEVQGAATSTPVITRYHEEPLPEGSVRRGEVVEVMTVASALRRLWSSGGFKAKDVALGMGGQRVFARDLVVPLAPLAHIRESLQFHVQDLLPVPVTEAFFDFYPISESSSDEGPVVNGLLIAAIKDAVRANVEAVTLAGLHPVHVDLIPFALARALAPVGSGSGRAVLLGIGANTTNVVIAQDGVPQFVRIISGGGDDITRALSTQLPLSLAEAESLKRRLGMESAALVPEQRQALEVIYSVAGELLNGIRNTLDYFTGTKKNSALERIVVSGGGTHLIGFIAALSELTGLPVVQAELLGGARLSRGLQSNSTAEQQDAMSTAFGLALGTSA
jgi:type IV pilus assembly protein PilM